MAADVRIQIEDYEIAGPAIDNEVLFVTGRILLSFAKNADAGLSVIGSGRINVLVSPGTPESFHRHNQSYL
jgi:hypothetical protein